MNFLYRFMWRCLIKKKTMHYEVKGLGDVKHLSVVDGDLVIIIDGANKL